LTMGAGVRLGPLPLDALSGMNMKGFALHHAISSLEKTKGSEALMAWRNRLPLALKNLTDPRAVTAVAWVPAELYFDCVAHLAGDEPRQALWVGYQAARDDINQFFRVAMALASPATITRLSSRFWKHYFDQSHMFVEQRGPQHLAGRIEGWPLSDVVSRYEIAGSMLAWMDASRVKNVQLTRVHAPTRDLLELEATWS
jgi:hypothetical protein